MSTEIFCKHDFMKMDPMHDCNVTSISLQNKTLTVVYDDLDEGVLGEDGLPFYKNRKLTIKYEFDTDCNGVVYHHKMKSKKISVDILENPTDFNKFINKYEFQSYKYSVDSFGNLNLYFSDLIRYLEISMDAKEVTYIWE